MTINEQIKEILEIHRKSVDWKKEAPTFNDYRANKIISLFQPKTTSTDIKEQSDKDLLFFRSSIDAYQTVNVDYPKEARINFDLYESLLNVDYSLEDYKPKLLGELFGVKIMIDPMLSKNQIIFAPHLSNKSELKKEAVMGFVGFLSKQLLAVGGTWQELELKQKTLDKINKSAQTYLSFNEKEVSDKEWEWKK